MSSTTREYCAVIKRFHLKCSQLIHYTLMTTTVHRFSIILNNSSLNELFAIFVTFLFEIIAFRHLIEMAIRRSCNLSEAYGGHIGRQY